VEHNWLASIQDFNYVLTFEITLKDVYGRECSTVNSEVSRHETGHSNICLKFILMHIA
jgi:hypothetical protein